MVIAIIAYYELYSDMCSRFWGFPDAPRYSRTTFLTNFRSPAETHGSGISTAARDVSRFVIIGRYSPIDAP